MKLGVVFVAYSGLEFLKPSLKNVRDFSDFTVVIVPRTSNTGEPQVEYSERLLYDLQNETNLIDLVYKMPVPLAKSPLEIHNNFRMLRNKGRELCRFNDCTHFHIRDCDEFYFRDEFSSMLKLAEEDKYDTIVVPIIEYYIDPFHKAKDICELHVPALCNVDFPVERNLICDARVDTGRITKPVGNCKILTVDDIVMQHFTCVRYNSKEMERKYYGHGHLNRLGSKEDFLKRISNLSVFTFVQVPDYFRIYAYWKEEFYKYAGQRDE